MLGGSPICERRWLLGLFDIESLGFEGQVIAIGTGQLTHKYLIAIALVRTDEKCITGGMLVDILTVDSHRSHSGDTPREETHHSGR